MVKNRESFLSSYLFQLRKDKSYAALNHNVDEVKRLEEAIRVVATYHSVGFKGVQEILRMRGLD